MAEARSVEARLQRVEDELAIRRALVDYATFLDSRDHARYVDLFAPDGEWANAGGRYRGAAAIRRMLEDELGPAEAVNRSSYHLISNPRIDLDGDRATAASRFLFVTRGPDGAPKPSLAGTYSDQLVRLDGAWKIRRRVAEDVMPAADEWQAILHAGEPEA